MREDRGQNPLDGARLGRQPRDASDVQVRGLGSNEKVRVEVDRRVRTARMVHPDRNAGARALGEITIHAQGDRHLPIVGKVDLAHRDWLERLVRQLTENGRAVEPDLRPLGGRVRRGRGAPIVADHVVQR